MASDGTKRLVLVGDDFTNFEGNPGTADSLTVGGYGCWTDTTTNDASINPLPTEHGGVIQLATNTTAHHQATITSGGGIGTLGAVTHPDDGSSYLTAFEARVRFGQVSGAMAFIGLSEEALDANNTLSDTDGNLADKDFLGFHVDAGGPTALDFVYEKEGQTAQVLKAAIQTIVADTWYKIGFLFDPDAPPERRLSLYVDNAENATYGTDTQVDAATFPSGEELAFNATLKTVTANKTLDIDWWAYAQLID
jgi:hypothetical protein